MAEVLRTPFVTPERLAELRGMGVDIAPGPGKNVDGLFEPMAGETVLGTLTDDEALLLASLVDYTEKREDMIRVLSGQTMILKGEHIAAGNPGGPPQHPFHSPDESAEFCRLCKLCDMLHNQLYFSLGERFGAHHYKLAIRTKNRVVRQIPLYGETQHDDEA